MASNSKRFWTTPWYDFDYLLSRDDMLAFWNYYVHHPSEAESPLASPLRAASFDGLPKTLILTAECDPLRDEGEEYGKKLRGAGVDAVTRRYPGMIHGFVNMAGAIPQGREAMLQIAKQLKQLGTDESVLSAKR
jgi:acetyl esterase